jgi:hypothetical protein
MSMSRCWPEPATRDFKSGHCEQAQQVASQLQKADATLSLEFGDEEPDSGKGL